MGKPGKFDTLRQDKVIAELEAGTTIKTACAIAGITTQTYYYHCDHSQEFKERAEMAKRKADAKVEKSLFQTACEGNVPALKYWLTNRDPENWGDKADKDDGRDLDRFIQALRENARN